jgi:hypothetical protein
VNGANTIRFTHTSGAGYTVTAVSVAFTTPPIGDPLPPVGNNGQFANEPAGMTALLNHTFNVAVGPRMEDVYNSTQIVNDGTAPLSPPQVARHRLEAFAREGGGELHYSSPTNYREMFMGLWWRTNAAFQGRTVGNKLFFLRGVPGTNACLLFNNTTLSNGRGTIIFCHNSGGIDNSHIMSGGSGLIGLPNVNSSAAICQTGVWAKLELWIRCSTTRTARDGAVQWWVNGTPVGAYTQLNYCGVNGETMNNWVMSQTWDGSGDMGTSNTVAWEHYVDHVYVSGKN